MTLFTWPIFLTLFLLFILIAIHETKQDIIAKIGDVEYAISCLIDKMDDHHAPVCMIQLEEKEEEHEDC